jgi:hypothetical protein
MPVPFAGTEWLMHITRFRSDSSLAAKAYTTALIVVRFSNCKKGNKNYVWSRTSCRGLSRKLEISPVSCQYILSFILFITDNPNNFQTGLEIHGWHTRNKNQLFIPIANLTSVQKGITCSGITIYNSLPSNILNLKNDRKQFKNQLYM